MVAICKTASINIIFSAQRISKSINDAQRPIADDSPNAKYDSGLIVFKLRRKDRLTYPKLKLEVHSTSTSRHEVQIGQGEVFPLQQAKIST